MMMRARAGLVIAGLMCVVAIAACGKRSDGKKSASIPSDLDSMAFQPESARVRADVDSGNAQFLQAWRTGSADLFANIFAEDGAQLMQGGGHIMGRDSIAAHMNRVFSKIRMRHGSITTQDLNIVGDRAYERGKYVFETVPVKGGKAVIDSGHFVEIWKYEQGQWKMWRDIGVPRD